MTQMNQLLYRTLSCRTTPETAQRRANRLLMLPVLIGAGLGTLLRTAHPALFAGAWLTQGLMLSAAHRTLWDVFCAALIPPALMLLMLLLCGMSAFGQIPAGAVLLLRGAAIGNALAGCTEQLSVHDSFLAAAVLVLPFGFLSALMLVSAARDVLPFSAAAARYLLRGIEDPAITQKRQHLLQKLLCLLMLSMLLAGLQTVLTWAMNNWLIAAI